MLITASGVMRGNKKIDLKAIADRGVELALKEGHTVRRWWDCLIALSVFDGSLLGRAVAAGSVRGCWSSQPLTPQPPNPPKTNRSRPSSSTR